MPEQRRPRRPSRATVHTTVHLPPALLAEVDTLANGGSRNAVLVALIEEGLRSGVEHQHATLLEAAVQRAVARAMDRIGDLAFRSALDSDETRRLVIAVCFKVLGSEPAKELRREAHSAAWQRLREPAPTPPEADGVCQDSRTLS
jgi:hypothetical protein